MPNDIFEDLIKSECKKFGVLRSLEEIKKQIEAMLDRDFAESEKAEKGRKNQKNLAKAES